MHETRQKWTAFRPTWFQDIFMTSHVTLLTLKKIYHPQLMGLFHKDSGWLVLHELTNQGSEPGGVKTRCQPVTPPLMHCHPFTFTCAARQTHSRMAPSLFMAWILLNDLMYFFLSPFSLKIYLAYCFQINEIVLQGS